ncbi:Guanosine-diphosphatase [Puccinia graminis f. sp. tritici]|uniref:guanosine-diphosphatase n=1 Tax=Puccinia graminis f. sp. tritici TaxID=56615 RepID=A0A5B0S793_PUCGR|nr:Guanosine-diphosphatase [Puccinia graminis f. sp. tritici]
MRIIWREEGFRGLYRGLGPTIIGYLPTWAIYFTVYDAAKAKLADSRPNHQEDVVAHVLAAMTAGATSTIATNPLWLIKTRFMTQRVIRDPQSERYRHTFDAFRRIHAKEGLRGFYRGLVPSLFGVTHVAIQFPLYEQIKLYYHKESAADLPSSRILIASATSKMLASLLTYPHEVLRTRLQVHALKSASPSSHAYKPSKMVYPKLRDIFRMIVQNEGLAGLYHGMGVNLIRTVPSSALTILTSWAWLGQLGLRLLLSQSTASPANPKPTIIMPLPPPSSSSSSSSASSSAVYHPLHPLQGHHHSQSPILSTGQSTDDQTEMGSFQRFIKYGGWRRNSLLVILIIITFSYSIIFRFRNSPPPSSSSSDLISLANDPNCRPPPGHPSHRYALMIDAGSTGSRIHVYRFSYCLPASSTSSSSSGSILPKLENELFFKTQPGLSSYAGRPIDAAESLRPLLQAALDGVPLEQRSCTPISVKATAGLRLLGDSQSKEILDEVSRWLRASWPFKLSPSGAVSIMDGADEGVYAWVTINYLLKTIGPIPAGQKRNTTAAVMDLGGASTQIVFEPERTKLESGGHVYELAFGGKTHALYQHSHLGYGLMEARRAVHQMVGYSELWRRKIEWSELASLGPLGNPCLQPHTSRKVSLVPSASPSSSESTLPQIVEFVGSAGGFAACRRVVELVIGKDAVCKLKPCAFAGVYQPSFAEAFADGPIYALSYFYDRLNPLGIKESFTLSELEQLIEPICSRTVSDGGRFEREIARLRTAARAKKGPSNLSDLDLQTILAELDDRPETCLDLSFIYAILDLGYQLDHHRPIIISKKITAIELGWALGATIDLLEKTAFDDCPKS